MLANLKPINCGSGYNDNVTIQKIETGASTTTSAYSAVNLEKLPATLSLLAGFNYEIYAVGTCSDGCLTEQSNRLLVATLTPSLAPSGPCTDDELSSTTDWALGCGIVDCNIVCSKFSMTCNVNGMCAVDTLAKGVFVLKLFNVPVTFVDSTPWADSPVIDYYSPTKSEYYWNGAVSSCTQTGLEPVSRRVCCCGSNCPVS